MDYTEFLKRISKVAYITFVHPHDAVNGIVIKVHYKSGYVRGLKLYPAWVKMYVDLSEVTVDFDVSEYRHIDVYLKADDYYRFLLPI